MVLVVVDTQKLITNEKLFQFDLFVHHVRELIRMARKHKVEVIYVRHDDGVGSELTPGTSGYEIYDQFQPKIDEKIFDKTVNSIFKDSGLLEYLHGQKEIIIVGLQTDFCIDASIKCGFEHGFQMIVPENSNTTIDNKFMTAKQSYQYYNEMMWPGRFAKCPGVEETIRMMKA